jgi:membrane protein implicated in regulation of membrane protease activity
MWVVWLAVPVVLGPIEVMTRRLICAAVSLGSLCGALAAAFGATLFAQIAVVAAVCAVGLCSRRLVLRSYHRAVINWETLYRDLGNTARVTEPVDGQAGQVRYGGIKWEARSFGARIPPGTRVKVFSLVNNMTLGVYPANGQPRRAKGPDGNGVPDVPGQHVLPS